MRDESLIKNYFNKGSILASGLRTIFLPDNPNELCDKTNLLLQKKRAGNNSNITKEGIVAIIDKWLEFKCLTPTQHKKKFKKSILYSICDYIRWTNISSSKYHKFFTYINV